MKKIILALGMGLLISQAALSEDNPEKILRETNEAALDYEFETDSSEIKNQWKEWVREKNWGDNGSYNGGVQEFKDRSLLVASGVAFVNVRIGQPGWNEARISAYERAEMAAKTQIMHFFSSNIDSFASL